jgi:hypothetical protein
MREYVSACISDKGRERRLCNSHRNEAARGYWNSQETGSVHVDAKADFRPAGYREIV